MKNFIVMLMIVLFLGGYSCKDNPVSTKPENHTPIIFALTVFPHTIGLTDSAIVICNAMDPDADTLVYDWITDGSSRIKDAGTSPDNERYNTHENFQILYPKNLNIQVDTLWVQCFARDRRGKSDNRLVFFTLKK